jgi:hypothetical protein
VTDKVEDKDNDHNNGSKEDRDNKAVDNNVTGLTILIASRAGKDNKVVVDNNEIGKAAINSDQIIRIEINKTERSRIIQMKGVINSTKCFIHFV